IQPSLLAEGKFPIIGIDAIAVRVTGSMFGGEIDAGLVGGILKLDSNFAIIGTFDTTTPVFQRVFYLGLQGGFSMAGLAGFTLRVGLSELGPLQAFINIEVPGGILLEPYSGLTINDFSAGVEFFKTLPSIDDPFALRSSVFQLPTSQTADQWLLGLQQQVALQARTVSTTGQNGFFAAFTAPMTITGSARIYSMYTSQAVFNGQVIVKISTDGKILIVGSLNFADNNVSISGRLYADLSKVATGDVTILFLASVPDQVRLLSIYGKLKMGFRNSSGQEVTFDVSQTGDPQATTTAPTGSLGGAVTNGGSIDVSVVNPAVGNPYLDVVIRAPNGATLDYSTILDADDEFTVTVNDVLRTITGQGTPRPMLLVQVDGGLRALPLEVVGGDVVYRYTPAGGGAEVVVVVLAASEVEGTPTNAELLEIASRREGVSLFRYDLGAGTLPMGTVRVDFLANSFANAAILTDGGTVAGALNAASFATFTVTGATAVITDPGPGSTIDVHVLNGRGWLDVTFTPPTGYRLDIASITDLAAEFVLSGPGLGSIQLDTSRAPTLLTVLSGAPALDQALQFRFWLTGAFATPTGDDRDDVALTFIARTWSVTDSSTADAVLAGGTIAVGQTPGTITVTFPVGGTNGIPSGFELDPDSVTDLGRELVDQDTAAPGIQIVVSGGWVITLDENRAITRIGTTNQYLVPVIVTASGAAPLTVSVTMDTGTVAWTTDEATGTQPDVPGAVTVPTGNQTYVDVTFVPSAGSMLNLGSIGSGAISVGGFGGAGVVVTGAPVWLGGTTFRFLLNGSFRPGVVAITVHLTTFSDNSGRSPPTGLTLVHSFLVAGATADVVRTVPETSTTPETVVALSGAAIGRDVINALRYLEITFRPSSGFAVDHSTVGGGEVQLRDAAGTLIALGTPVRVGLSDTYRYSFTATLAVGRYTVTFVADSFGDTSGLLNQSETETFDVASPTAALANPVRGQVINAGDLNGRGWVDITFPAFGGAAVDPASLFDTASEITITTSTGATLAVLGRPVLVDAATSRYRFFFTGHTDGNLVVTFVDDGWTNLFGTRWSSRSRVVDSVTVGPFAAPTVEADVSAGTVTPRTWFDVVFTPVPGATLDVASILAGGQITFSGAGSEGLTAVTVLQVDATTFRYLYTGTLQTGTVTATFVAGSWRDSAGNLGAAGTSSFRLITQGTSFFIEISGGILLEAAGLTDEPLLDLKAEVVLEIDTARSLFKLTFVGQLSIIKLGTVGATAGVFVLDMGDGIDEVPQFWGVATLETNFSALQPYGLDMFAKGTLQINLTGSTKVETLTLPGLGEGGTDLVRTFTLNPYSFAV
ncbi:MAG TPA: hypothetical protein VLA55_05785, partial [Ornithinibacter sp.]|nr:hypothetical protein [Ornithinibacter sp.]